MNVAKRPGGAPGVEGSTPGQAAVTCRPLPGGGAAWYVATQLDDASWSALLRRVLEDDGGPVAEVLRGVEAVRGVPDDGARGYLFLLDHTGREQRVIAHGVELLTGAEVTGEVVVPPLGAAVVREVIRPG